MTTIDKRFNHAGSVPTDGNTPGDTDTTILDGAYRQAPGADTFWGPRYRAPEDPDDSGGRA